MKEGKIRLAIGGSPPTRARIIYHTVSSLQAVGDIALHVNAWLVPELRDDGRALLLLDRVRSKARPRWWRGDPFFNLRLEGHAGDRMLFALSSVSMLATEARLISVGFYFEAEDAGQSGCEFEIFPPVYRGVVVPALKSRHLDTFLRSVG